ncbi:MAG: hypothetical protein R3F07_19995 [Opitutaceae bacterium]
MSKKLPKPTPFPAEKLPKKINDLRGVGEGELSRYFPRGRESATIDTAGQRADPLRVKAAQGLGLSKGRRFFRAGPKR